MKTTNIYLFTNFHHMLLGHALRQRSNKFGSVAPFNIIVIELKMFAVMVVCIIKNVVLQDEHSEVVLS